MSGPAPFAGRVLDWLDDHEWQVRVDADSDAEVLRAHLFPSDGEAPWPLLVIAHERDSRLGFYSLVPDEVDVQRRPAVAAALTLINDGLVVGCVEMTMSDGDARIRTSLDLGGAELDDAVFDALVARLVHNNLELAATYFDAIAAVADGSSTPADAVAAAERE